MLENKKRSVHDLQMSELKKLAPHNAGVLRDAARQLTRGAKKSEKDMADLLEQYAYDPTKAGLGDEPALISEDDWIRDASVLIKKHGPELYLRSMMEALRGDLGGIPLMTAKNKNDMCPCGSTKKFGKCCGVLLEDDDPNSCRAIGHEYGPWGKVKDSTWVHTCEKCPAVETAEGVLEIGCEGESVIVVPCRGCKAAPDQDAAWEIYSRVKKTQCIACKQVPVIKLLSIEHLKDGKHVGAWTESYLKWAEQVWTFSQFTGFVGEFILHTKCLKEHGVFVNENI